MILLLLIMQQGRSNSRLDNEATNVCKRQRHFPCLQKLVSVCQLAFKVPRAVGASQKIIRLQSEQHVFQKIWAGTLATRYFVDQRGLNDCQYHFKVYGR